MSIQGMREWVKKHKIWIGVLFGLLIISLLATYSIGSLTKYGSLFGGSDSQSDYSGFEKAIAQERATVKSNPNDYSSNYSLASTLYEYASTLSEDSQSGDSSTDQSSQIMECLQEAGNCYVTAIQNAPAELNDLAKAQMYTKAAQCKAYTGDTSSAADYYQKAVKLAPTDLSTAEAYAQFLAYSSDYDGAIQVMNSLIANTDDQSTISSAKSFIQQIETAKSSAASASSSTGNSSTSNATESGNTSATNSSTTSSATGTAQ